MRDVFRLANCQIAKEVQRLCKKHGKRWTGGIFCKQSATITEIVGGKEIQLERLRYVMSQGTKEGLCPHPTKWPGIQSASAWLSGSMRLTGRWIDRTAFYEVERGASRRKKKISRKWLAMKELKACQSKVILPLAPLPCMDDMSPKERQAIAHELCSSILMEHKDKIAKVRRDWKKSLCDPRKFAFQPRSAKRGNVPEVHAETPETWRLWKIEWDDWVNQYERASRRLREGIAEALNEFPEGCFLPSGCFCRAGPRSRHPPILV